jgi:DNA (cytosine-5)-methyltransferase 1
MHGLGHPLRVASLFSGYGGLDLAIRRVLPDARTVLYCEREGYAAAVLAARMEAGDLDPAPICTDIRELDGRAFRGVVDLVAGGFPCQDVSVAGKRAGLEGERSGLWSEMVRVIRDMGPSLVYVENTPGLVTWLGGVLGDLASLGFDAEWGVLGAADVGAPHRRDRLWLLAHAGRLCGQRFRIAGHVDGAPRAGESDPGQRERHGNATRDGREALADSDGQRWDGQPTPRVHGLGQHRNDDVGRGCGMGDPPGPGLEGRRQGLPTRTGHHGWPPGPEDSAAWSVWSGPEPAIRRGADGTPDRLDRLRLLGNGVVPQQGAEALMRLIERGTGGGR